MKALAFVVLGIIIVSGCTTQPTEQDRTRAATACILLCKLALGRNTSLENGPCIQDQLQEDWVCDISHYPRQAVDNLPENQCPSYGKTNHHFIELDEYCELINVL